MCWWNEWMNVVCLSCVRNVVGAHMPCKLFMCASFFTLLLLFIIFLFTIIPSWKQLPWHDHSIHSSHVCNIIGITILCIFICIYIFFICAAKLIMMFFPFLCWCSSTSTKPMYCHKHHLQMRMTWHNITLSTTAKKKGLDIWTPIVLKTVHHIMCRYCIALTSMHSLFNYASLMMFYCIAIKFSSQKVKIIMMMKGVHHSVWEYTWIPISWFATPVVYLLIVLHIHYVILNNLFVFVSLPLSLSLAYITCIFHFH